MCADFHHVRGCSVDGVRRERRSHRRASEPGPGHRRIRHRVFDPQRRRRRGGRCRDPASREGGASVNAFGAAGSAFASVAETRGEARLDSRAGCVRRRRAPGRGRQRHPGRVPQHERRQLHRPRRGGGRHHRERQSDVCHHGSPTSFAPRPIWTRACARAPISAREAFSRSSRAPSTRRPRTATSPWAAVSASMPSP